MLRAIVMVSLLAACASSRPASPPASPRAADVPAACRSLDLFIAADAVRLAGHPCRAWIEATRGRVFGTGVAFSGTVVATTAARGAGLFLTCHHCGAGRAGTQVLDDPETSPPSTMQVGDPQQFYLAYLLFAPIPPPTAYDAAHNLTKILPRDDIAVGTISSKLYKLRGQIGVVPPPHVLDGAIPLQDPRGIASSTTPWVPAKPGTPVLLLGYPRDLPERSFRGELVASVGEVLDDAAARDKLSRAEADEASIPYDPEVELVVAARAVSGMSGGGVFDADGRFVGVMVRGTTTRVDGTYLTRIVRATFIWAQLESALARADGALRARITPFLPALPSPAARE